MKNMLLTTFASVASVFYFGKLISGEIKWQLDIKDKQLNNKEIEINGKESFINKQENKIYELINKVYQNKIKEVDKLKEICDECKIYQNKWTDGKEIYYYPGSNSKIYNRTKCSIHGDIIGDLYDNYLISDYPDDSGDVGKYYSLNNILYSIKSIKW